MHWTTSFELPFRARRSGSCGARVRLRHTVTYLKRDSVGRVFKELISSGKFKEYEYAKCGRVVKTRVSGGKIRQDSKIENQ